MVRVVTPRLQVFDETLRDGEQQAGLCYPDAVKLELAHRIAATGVDAIDTMPAIDEAEAALVRKLSADGLRRRLSCATPLGNRFVDLARACEVDRVILFYSVSDRLLWLRDEEVRRDSRWRGTSIDESPPADLVAEVRDRALARISQSIDYAKSSGLHVDFAAEDASRADRGFLGAVIRELGPRIGHFMLCDTVGVLRPDTTASWISELIDTAGETPLAVHFHNDMGMALENTLQAVVAGAQMISGTFRGVGERAGNVALEQVLDGLKNRHGIVLDTIDYGAVDAVTALLDEHGFRPAAPYSHASQRHSSGIHVQSLLADKKSYCIFDDREPEIWFGKLGGASNFRYLFERKLGRSLPDAAYERLSATIKGRARAEQRCYSAADVADMIESGELRY